MSDEKDPKDMDTLEDGKPESSSTADSDSPKDATKTADTDGPKESHTDTEEQDKQPDNTDGGLVAGMKWFFSSWKRILAFLVIIAAVFGLMEFGYAYVRPRIILRNLSNKAISQSSTKIVSYDHSWDGTKLDREAVDGLDVNTTQYLIHYKDKGMTDKQSKSSCMVFRGEGKNPKHSVKVVISPGDSKSANFLTSQGDVLKKHMQSGDISTEVCLLLNEDEYSAVADEAIGEIDYNDKDKTWDAIHALTAVDPTEFKMYDEKAASVLRTVTNLGVGVHDDSRISTSSLKNGSFMQWSRMMTNENKVEKIPALWVDHDNLSSGDTFRMYDADALDSRLSALN